MERGNRHCFNSVSGGLTEKDMARRPWRLFLDASTLSTGLLSLTGRAYEVLRLFEIGVAEPPTSQVPRRQVKPASAHLWHKRLLSEGIKHAVVDIRYPGHFYHGRKKTFLKWVDIRVEPL
jgi:hypothetical protein